MPMKTLKDMTEKNYVWVTIRKLKVLIWTIDIRLCFRQTKEVAAADDSPDDFSMHFISAKELLEKQSSTEFGGHLDLVNQHNGFWKISRSDANHGWGPFLYDIAMELAAEHDVWLCSDDGMVTTEARAVWQKYFTSRPDVDRIAMPDRQAWKLDYSRFAYRKNDQCILKTLEESKQLKIMTLLCDEPEEYETDGNDDSSTSNE
jgi:hypothetical protein